jgi:hypothetical protein
MIGSLGARRIAPLISATMIAGSVIGCSVKGPPFEPEHLPRPKSVIYLYRPYRIFGSAIRPPITCGDSTVKLGPGGYHAFVVDPGTIVCSTRYEASDAVELRVGAGQANYLEEEIGWGALIGHPHLHPIDSDAAHNAINECCELQE